MKSFVSRLIAIAALLWVASTLLQMQDERLVFANYQALILVLGGSLAAIFLSHDLVQVAKAFGCVFDLFFTTTSNAKKLKNIQKLVDIARQVKESGGLACIDDIVEKEKVPPIIRYGLGLILDGYTEVQIQEMMKNYMLQEEKERKGHETVWGNLAFYAPALGMIGTVFGMIKMLASLNVDASNIGEGLSLALLTTLYGAIAANLFFRPMEEYLVALRVAERSGSEAYVEALMMIKKRMDPVLVADFLNSHLPFLHQVRGK